MRKIKYLFLILLITLCLNVKASTNTEMRTRDDLKINDWISVSDSNINNILETPKVNETEKVYDFANLFTEDEEKNIYSKIQEYITLSNFDLAVVTIDENNKYDEVEYADDFYDYNNFGFNDSRDGMLFLIDMDNRRIYISTTGYAIKQYNDYRIDRIIDAGYDNLKNGKYADCILQMIDEASYYFNQEIPKGNENLVIDGNNVYIKDVPMSLSKKVFIVTGISSIITLIISIIMYNKTKLKIKVGNLQSYLLNAKKVNYNEQFIRSAITRTPINTDSGSSSGGSSSGGSSFHSSSSGGFHGGGGRGF